MNNINKTLFFYFIIKTDNRLDIINNNNKTYFNSLKNDFLGDISHGILSKDEFLIHLQNNIDLLLINSFHSKIVFELDKDCFKKINPKYIGKKLEFHLITKNNKIYVKSVIFENNEFLI